MFSSASEKNIIWVEKHDNGFWVTNEQDLFEENLKGCYELVCTDADVDPAGKMAIRG